MHSFAIQICIIRILSTIFKVSQTEHVSQLNSKVIGHNTAQKQLSYHPSLSITNRVYYIYKHTPMGKVFSCESPQNKHFKAHMQKKITSQRNQIRRMDKLLTRQHNSFHQKECAYREKISRLQSHLKKKDVQTAALKQIRQNLLLILSRKIIEHRKQIQSYQEIDQHQPIKKPIQSGAVEEYESQLRKKQQQIQELTAKFKQIELYDSNIQRMKDKSEKLIREITAEVDNMQGQPEQLRYNQNQQEIFKISRRFNSLIEEKQHIINQITSQPSFIKTQPTQQRTSLTLLDTSSIENLQQSNKMTQSQRFVENASKLRQINEELSSFSRQRLSAVSESKRRTLNDLKAKLSRYVEQLQRLKNPQKTAIKQQHRPISEVQSVHAIKQQQQADGSKQQ